MKRTALAFVLALLLLFAVGCGAKYPFAGKWQEEGTGTYYEFNNLSLIHIYWTLVPPASTSRTIWSTVRPP